VISPIFEDFAKKISSIGFYKVDVDASQEISEEVGIRAVSITSSTKAAVLICGPDAHFHRLQEWEKGR